MAILTFELKAWPWPWRYRHNSFLRHTIQWWWTHDFKISQWTSYGRDKLIHGLLLPLNKVWPWPWRYWRYSFTWHTVIWRWTNVPMILKSHNELHSYGPEKLIYGHFWPSNSKCDLDLGDIDVILSHNTPSNDGEMFQMILKSHKEQHSYCPDKLMYCHFWSLNSKCELDLKNNLIFSRNTPSNDGEQMCQMIIKSHNK